jgi:ribosomal protein L18
MSLIPMDAAHIQQIIQNDSQQMRTMISWLEQRNVSYGQNMTTGNMTTAGIAAGDQTAILAFIADVARLVTFLHGTLPGVAADVRIDIANVLGVM